MTTANEILIESLGRVPEGLHAALDGRSEDDILWQPEPGSNSAGWLTWHLTRVEDDHLAEIGGVEQVWTAQGFARRFDLPYDDAAHGYGQSAADVAAFGVGDAALLLEYQDAVHAQAVRIIEALDDAGFARIVDERWDPPVTAAVRVVSVINDMTQHLGQVAYVLGLAGRR